MKIGIGLPASIAGVPGSLILDWARQADTGPFSSLGLIDRIVYDNYEPLIALAVVAGVTQRVRLATTVLLAPLRSPGLLAKQAASLDALSNGRLTLGLGIGLREDDFDATQSSFHDRGKRFSEHLATMERIWAGQPFSETIGPIGPRPVRDGGPEVLIGGYSAAAVKRVRRWGNGFMAGGGNVEVAKKFFRLTEQTWQEAGRPGKPRLVGCSYFALGADAAERGGAYIRDYYAFRGADVQNMARTIPSSPDAIRAQIRAYEDIGTDELILWATIPAIEQVALLADVINA